MQWCFSNIFKNCLNRISDVVPFGFLIYQIKKSTKPRLDFYKEYNWLVKCRDWVLLHKPG